jgi:hypothetical protein
VPQIGTTFISKRRLGDFGTPMGAKLVLELEKKRFQSTGKLYGKRSNQGFRASNKRDHLTENSPAGQSQRRMSEVQAFENRNGRCL